MLLRLSTLYVVSVLFPVNAINSFDKSDGFLNSDLRSKQFTLIHFLGNVCFSLESNSFSLHAKQTMDYNNLLFLFFFLACKIRIFPQFYYNFLLKRTARSDYLFCTSVRSIYFSIKFCGRTMFKNIAFPLPF
jgi:hypothetical protein